MKRVNVIPRHDLRSLLSVEMCHPEIRLFFSRVCAARTYKSNTMKQLPSFTRGFLLTIVVFPSRCLCCYWSRGAPRQGSMSGSGNETWWNTRLKGPCLCTVLGLWERGVKVLVCKPSSLYKYDCKSDSKCRYEQYTDVGFSDAFPVSLVFNRASATIWLTCIVLVYNGKSPNPPVKQTENEYEYKTDTTEYWA